jgi:hypothetical protein
MECEHCLSLRPEFRHKVSFAHFDAVVTLWRTAILTRRWPCSPFLAQVPLLRAVVNQMGFFE